MEGSFIIQTAVKTMSAAPLVSILMPAYNAEKFIKEAINSIVNQDYSNWELLILDDASTDGTTSVVSSFNDPRIHTFHHSENKGYLLSCNELFEKTRGDFITFLDADDSCSANRLSVCLNEFRHDSNLQFLSTSRSKITKSGRKISSQSIEIDYNRYSTDHNYNPTICCATIFLKKELFDTIGGYRVLFNGIGGEDYFWLWELSRFGVGKHVNKSVYSYRFHENQTSRAHDDELHLFVPELIKLLRLEFRSSSWNDEQAQVFVQATRQNLLNSGYELNLRRAQVSLNRDQRDFSNYVLKCLRNVRKPQQIRPLLYLIYSWLIRKGRNVNQ